MGAEKKSRGRFNVVSEQKGGTSPSTKAPVVEQSKTSSPTTKREKTKFSKGNLSETCPSPQSFVAGNSSSISGVQRSSRRSHVPSKQVRMEDLSNSAGLKAASMYRMKSTVPMSGRLNPAVMRVVSQDMRQKNGLFDGKKLKKGLTKREEYEDMVGQSMNAKSMRGAASTAVVAEKLAAQTEGGTESADGKE